MKEYGDIENDLKIVQGICKKEKELFLNLNFKLGSGSSRQTSVSAQRVGRVGEVSAGEPDQAGESRE